MADKTDQAAAPPPPPAGAPAAPGWMARLPQLVRRSWPFVAACVVAYALEHAALHRIVGDDRASPLAQGLFGIQSFYASAVSAWPRELMPRYTTLVYINPEKDPTASGLASNLCLQREYVAKLLPAVARRDPMAIVVDMFPRRNGCLQEAPTAALVEALTTVGAQVPVVIGVAIDTRADPADAGRPPRLYPRLAMPTSPSLREGILNFDTTPRRLPLGWTVRDDADAAGRWRDSLALAAATVREPALLERAPRLKRLKDDRDNPFISIIAEDRFATLQAADILCDDAATRPAFASACKNAIPGSKDPGSLRGRIVVVGETGTSIDQHDTTVIGRVPGALLQANYIEALLDDRYFVPAPAWADLLAGFLFFVAIEASLHGRRPWRSLFRLAMVTGSFVLLSVTARYLGYFIDPAVSLVVFVILMIGWLREWLPHAAVRLKGWVTPKRASP